ncbi:type II toxin-antitoxin system RelE/ParE family toxin [Desulfovibrio litoralis]|uniref:Uncharacterized protein n=1 Tax=Desulfovibrio litoralis DSM 11393 TaxID=1121455 RepID=A0A1M7SZB7_9BACT|nr:type II toxin-antitoxin system RelE/ParE family toxin [Desulfovibrio litoralis]SHN63810.1 hypothetical protein SAMN02745728_01409 [Desulfovibrio litoralis DSM 11393]
MGKILQIRLSASTYNLDDVLKAWPALYNSVWGDEKAFTFQAMSAFANSDQNRGVLNLVKDLKTALVHNEWVSAKKQALEPGIKEAEKKAKELDEYLANWDAKAANRASDELESILDQLEVLMKRLS